MKIKVRHVIALALVALVASSANAQVPRYISYQGVALNGGAKITGQNKVTIHLYGSAGGAASLFDFTMDTVNFDNNGVFGIMIGPLPTIDFSQPLFMGVAIAGGPELQPRAQVAAVPYSFYSDEAGHAKTADQLSSGPINYVTSITSNDNTITVKAPAIHQPAGDVVDISVDSVLASRVVPPNGMQPGQTMQWSNNGWIGAYLNVPVGTVLAFAGDTIGLATQGWLLCDGRSLKNTDYPELYAVIHTANGESNGSFWLPDYRGLFLRGVSYNRADTLADPDNTLRSSTHGGNSGNEVGSVQGDMFKSHNHIEGLAAQDAQTVAYGYYTSSSVDYSANAPYGGLYTYPYTSTTGGHETRPKNAYVNWIIKAKP